jgi:hypothetical protein
MKTCADYCFMIANFSRIRFRLPVICTHMINLNQLRAFYQVAKCQNVSLAAKHLFVSQPAVTAQVKLFEDNCGYDSKPD